MPPEIPPHHQGRTAALTGGNGQRLLCAAEQAEHHGVIRLPGRQLPDIPGKRRQLRVLSPGPQGGNSRRRPVHSGHMGAIGQQRPAQKAQAAPGVAHPVLRAQECPQLPGQVLVIAAVIRRRVQIPDDLRAPSLHAYRPPPEEGPYRGTPGVSASPLPLRLYPLRKKATAMAPGPAWVPMTPPISVDSSPSTPFSHRARLSSTYFFRNTSVRPV